ncbi:Protein of unknown function [Flavobacterium frigoris]|uniref:DUF3037 domain-containing protein n=2 Tax=Flavobacterium frigoris TaxID=229204 RepID=A0A1H9C202_FLAFI|nr:Protein of unknown function [Flavobacterium frigoris]
MGKEQERTDLQSFKWNNKMKTDFYKYCILKYKHSPFLDESVNIGLLIFYSNTGKFSFNYSKNLSRIKYIYDNVPERTIKEYLKQIEKRIKNFSLNDDVFHKLEIDDLSSFVSKYLLPADGSVLQFSNYKNDFQLDFKNDFIEDILQKKHLIDDLKSQNNQSKEPELLHKFYKNLKGLDFKTINRDKKKFYIDYTVKNETGNEFKFDYGWQNGTLNLVKPISFDLKESKSIAEKAYKNLGQFIDLENEAKKSNLRYDLIIGRPQSKSLFKEYDHALSLLEKIKHAKIIEEKEIDLYSLKAIKAITG